MSNTANIPDDKLIKKCLKGKVQYQRALYNKYSSKMYAICFRYSKNTEDAKDILQETFLNVFKELHQYSRSGSLEGWIRTITINTAIGHYRKSLKQLDNHDIETIPEQSVQEETLSSIGIQEICSFINNLPNGYRIVFNMYAIEGYSHKEIGQALNISESASRSQLTRARKLLVQMINNSDKRAEL